MDTVSNMLLCTASIEVHQNERQSLMNGTGFRQTIPWRNFGLCTLYAPYKATQPTLSQHNDSETKRLNGAFTIPSSPIPNNGWCTTHTNLSATWRQTYNGERRFDATNVCLGHYNGSRKVPRALHGHGSIQAIKRFYSHTTLFQQGTQATSACIYPNIFSAVRGIHKQFTARSSCITRDRQSIFPHITASHGDLLAPYRCNKLFGQALTPIFSAPRADYTTMYNENLAYNQGIESNFPHITAPLGE